MERSSVRIAFVDARYHSFYGAQRSLFSLVTNLSKWIHPIVLLPGEGILAEKYRNAGVEVHVLPLHGKANLFGGVIPRLSRVEQLEVGLTLIRYNLKIARWLKTADVDILYANDLRALSYVGVAAKLLRKPVLWYVRADGLRPSLARIGASLATKVILIANGLKRDFPTDVVTKHEKKFITLYTGFDIREDSGRLAPFLREELNIPKQTPLIGIVGSITWRKGHDLLIQAMARLALDAHLVVIGDSPVGHEGYKQQLDRMIEQAGLSTRVHWLGYRESATSLYPNLDVLVLPSRSEGLPRVVIEGLFAGLPVVATDVGGVSEIIVSDYLGRVVPRDDVDSLAHALTEVLRDRSLHSGEIRERRKQYVRERFPLQAYVDGFEAIVDSLMGSVGSK